MLMNNYDYPVGADNDNAPWNEKKNKEVKVDVVVAETLSKVVTISTDDYSIESDFNDEEPDIIINEETLYDKWSNYHSDILELLGLLKEYAQDELKKTGAQTDRGRYLSSVIEDCDKWYIEDISVFEN